MSKDGSNITLNLASVGAGIEITQKYFNNAPFSMTKRFALKGSKDTDFDLLDLFGRLSKKEIDLFLQIKRNMDYRTNLSVVDFGELSASQRNHISNYLRSLITVGLVRRYQSQKSNTFIVNPLYIIPPDSVLQSVQSNWHNAK